MKRQDIEKLYERAAIHARAKGYKDDAYDFAGWIATRWLEGKSQHQTIDQSFCDYLRKFYGGTGKRCGGDGLLRSHRAAEFTPAGAGQYSVDEAFERRVYEQGSIDRPNSGSSDDEQPIVTSGYGTYGHSIRGGIRFLYEEGLTQGEIGEIYGLTESRVCQLLGVVRREIERDAGLERMREKIECGETELEIQWLSI